MKRFYAYICAMTLFCSCFFISAYADSYKGNEIDDIKFEKIINSVISGKIIDAIAFDDLSEKAKNKIEKEYLSDIDNPGVVVYAMDGSYLKIEVLSFEEGMGYSLVTSMISDDEVIDLNLNEVYVTDEELLQESVTTLSWINNSYRGGVCTSYSAYTIYAKIIFSEASVIPDHTYVRPYQAEAWFVYNSSNTPTITDFRVNAKVRGTLMNVSGINIVGDYTWISVVRASTTSSGTVYRNVNHLASDEMIEMNCFPESCFGATGSLYENGIYRPFNVFF